MTPAQITLVQDSFAQVVPIQATAAQLFYGRLFEIDPGTAPLFATADMAEQGRKLMATLGFVVGSLAQPAIVVPAAQALARRHAGWGVAEAQYASWVRRCCGCWARVSARVSRRRSRRLGRPLMRCCRA